MQGGRRPDILPRTGLQRDRHDPRVSGRNCEDTHVSRPSPASPPRWRRPGRLGLGAFEGMADIFPLRPSEHDTVQELLPWYVNGTLDGERSCACRGPSGGLRRMPRRARFRSPPGAGRRLLPLNVEDGWCADDRAARRGARRATWSRGGSASLRRTVPAGWAAGGALAASIAAALLVTGAAAGQPAEQTYRALGSATARRRKARWLCCSSPTRPSSRCG